MALPAGAVASIWISQPPATAELGTVEAGRRTVAGRFALDEWGARLPETFWPIWGGAPAAAALACHLRRRGGCHHCGRGPVRADAVPA